MSDLIVGSIYLGSAPARSAMPAPSPARERALVLLAAAPESSVKNALHAALKLHEPWPMWNQVFEPGYIGDRYLGVKCRSCDWMGETCPTVEDVLSALENEQPAPPVIDRGSALRVFDAAYYAHVPIITQEQRDIATQAGLDAVIGLLDDRTSSVEFETECRMPGSGWAKCTAVGCGNPQRRRIVTSDDWEYLPPVAR